MDILEEETQLVINPVMEEEEEEEEEAGFELSRTASMADVMSEAEEEELRAKMRRMGGSRTGSRRPSIVDITAKGGGTGRWGIMSCASCMFKTNSKLFPPESEETT
jgi:hypothetical protein